MLQFPFWKKSLIWLVCLMGIALATPNLFYNRVEQSNDALVEIERLGPTPERQEQAALWPSYLPSNLLSLGLDLRGGAHLLVEVQVQDVYQERVDSFWPQALSALRDVRANVGTIRRQDAPTGVLRIRIGEPSGMEVALSTLRALTQPVVSLTGAATTDFVITPEAGDILRIELSEAEQIATDDRTMDTSLEIIRRRVDETGTREPTIQRQGEDRILVQVPGLGSSQELIDLLGTTARLTFHPVVRQTSDATARPGGGNILLPDQEVEGIYYILEERAVVTGEQLVDAQPGFDQNGQPSVNFRFNPQGARIFGDYTLTNIGQRFAIVLDEAVISAPTIRSHIPGGSGQISGAFDVASSTQLAILLRAGALPAEIVILEERTIGPELGADSVEAGRLATMIAFAAVLVFMILSYGLFGVFANMALIFNVSLIIGLLSLMGATLTLPGIAGIVLTVGMAVDANVLVFERIREELKNSKGPARAIQIGYEKALSAIIDANITTFIAAVILFAIGSGPVRGFSVTLGIGIITSVFTTIYVTRLFIVTWFEYRRPKSIIV